MQQEKGRANSLRQARLKVQVMFCVPIVQSNVKQVIRTVTILNNTISFWISISYEYLWLIRKTQVRGPYLKLWINFSTQIYGLKISMQVIGLGAKTWLFCSLQYRFSSETENAPKILINLLSWLSREKGLYAAWTLVWHELIYEGYNVIWVTSHFFETVNLHKCESYHEKKNRNFPKASIILLQK